ncbi:MAG: hypothetical protein HC767_11675 [Akkermansiaceae bacterium]|nr:hypothetical protein [Akkermansiaceae bacterium]
MSAMHACAGEVVRLTFSPAYSPPETLAAAQKRAMHVCARPSMDMWAVGVIAHELALGAPVFPAAKWPRSAVMHAALGLRPYPWEEKVGMVSNLPELRGLGSVVAACLSRDAAKRPSADEFLHALNRMYDEHSPRSC